jgi:predicted TIM-barrel fold metal-dependent hydrolase
MDYRIISADDHIDMVWLPKDVWQKRVPAQWRDRAPRVVDTEDGPRWVCGDDRWDEWGGRKGAAGARGGRRSALDRGGVLEPGVLRPTTTALRLEDMARDGIDATVMYGPIVPLLIKDPALREVCYRAYNEWLAEFCATAPERLIGAGLIPIDEPKMAADEVRHLKELRLRTGMFLAANVEIPLWDEAWEPLWAAAQDLHLPLSLHAFTGHGLEDDRNYPRYRHSCLHHAAQRSLTQLIYYGIFDRFPGLKIVLAEFDIGWIPHFLWLADDKYRMRHEDPTITPKMSPSAYFQANVYASFIDDPIGLKNTDIVGADNYMWSNDYPHWESSWPRSREYIERNFQGVSEEIKRKVTWDNVTRLYDLGQ